MSPEAGHFADRVIRRCETLRSVVLAGFDPRPELLPEPERLRAGDSARLLARAYERFADDFLAALADTVPGIKVQIAFFEALGLPGMRAYARVVRRARDAGFLVVGDVKRGDIGSTAEAYAAAHFGAAAKHAGADVDAVTLNPYLGRDGIDPFLHYCRSEGRGAFALVRTSNPSASELQDLGVGGRPLFEHVAERVDVWGEDLRGAEGFSSLGAVVGATWPEELSRLRAAHPHLLLLVPGYGAQGGRAEDVAGALDEHGRGAWIASSRGILAAYRRAHESGADPRHALRAAAIAMNDDIRRACASRPSGPPPAPAEEPRHP